MALLNIARLVTFGTVTLFSIIVLGLSAHLIWFTTNSVGVYFTFAAMSIATAVLSLISLPVMFFIDRTRKGALTSMVVVELSWLGILWVLWLTSAALAAEANSITFVSGCGYANHAVDTACREFSAIEAFDFLNWIILLAYTGTLLTFSIIAASRGYRVWTSSVTTTDFTAPRNANNNGYPEKQEFAPGVQPGAQATPAPQYPPQNQQQYPQQNAQGQQYPQQNAQGPQQYPQQSAQVPQQYPQQNAQTPTGWAGHPQTPQV